MAHATSETHRTVYLTLTEEEASWLMDVCQNPITTPEVPNWRVVREAIWKALNNDLRAPRDRPA